MGFVDNQTFNLYSRTRPTTKIVHHYLRCEEKDSLGSPQLPPAERLRSPWELKAQCEQTVVLRTSHGLRAAAGRWGWLWGASDPRTPGCQSHSQEAQVNAMTGKIFCAQPVNSEPRETRVERPRCPPAPGVAPPSLAEAGADERVVDSSPGGFGWTGAGPACLDRAFPRVGPHGPGVPASPGF